MNVTATFGCGCGVCNGSKRLEAGALKTGEAFAIDPNDDGDGSVGVGGSYEARSISRPTPTPSR